MLKRGTIHVESHFPAYTVQLQERLIVGLNEGMQLVTEAVKAQPTDYQIRSRIIDHVKASRARLGGRSGRNIVGVVYADDWLSLFFEKGTYWKRGSKGRRTRYRSATVGGTRYRTKEHLDGNRGVKAQKYMKNGLKVGWPMLLEAMQRALPK